MMAAHITRLMTFAQHGEPKGYAASDMMRADLEALVLSAAYKGQPAESLQEARANLKEAVARGRDPHLTAAQCDSLVQLIDGVKSGEAHRAATRAAVLSDVDPVVLECWKLQGRKVGAMLREAQAAVIELQEQAADGAASDDWLGEQKRFEASALFDGRACSPERFPGQPWRYTSEFDQWHWNGWLARAGSAVPSGASAPAPAIQPQGEAHRAETEQTVHELRELAKRAPHVTEEDVLDIAYMPAAELRRRAIRGRDWHGHFSHCLDGLPIPVSMSPSPDGCWFPRDIRRIVEILLDRACISASDAGVSPVQAQSSDVDLLRRALTALDELAGDVNGFGCRDYPVEIATIEALRTRLAPHVFGGTAATKEPKQ